MKTKTELIINKTIINFFLNDKKEKLQIKGEIKRTMENIKLVCLWYKIKTAFSHKRELLCVFYLF